MRINQGVVLILLGLFWVGIAAGAASDTPGWFIIGFGLARLERYFGENQ